MSKEKEKENEKEHYESEVEMSDLESEPGTPQKRGKPPPKSGLKRAPRKGVRLASKTLSLKLKFLDRIERGEKVASVAADMKINTGTAYGWVKKKDQLRQQARDGLHMQTRHNRGSNYPQIDLALHQFLIQHHSRKGMKIGITDIMLQAQADK